MRPRRATVLINGAGGCMEPIALQSAKADGACVTAAEQRAMETFRGLLETGKLTPVIGGTFALSESSQRSRACRKASSWAG